MNTKEINLVRMKLDQIKPYWRNPRNNEDAIEIVADSLEHFDYQNPIIVDTEGTIIAGHTRYAALLSKKYETAQVIVSDMEKDKASAYRIIDNKAAEKSKWNWDKLVPELRQIKALDKFHVHFPELKITPVKLDLKPISQQNIDEKSQELETMFENREEHIEEIICPDCGHKWEQM